MHMHACDNIPHMRHAYACMQGMRGRTCLKFRECAQKRGFPWCMQICKIVCTCIKVSALHIMVCMCVLLASCNDALMVADSFRAKYLAPFFKLLRTNYCCLKTKKKK